MQVRVARIAALRSVAYTLVTLLMVMVAIMVTVTIAAGRIAGGDAGASHRYCCYVGKCTTDQACIHPGKSDGLIRENITNHGCIRPDGR